jgi:hypothetical protein
MNSDMFAGAKLQMTDQAPQSWASDLRAIVAETQLLKRTDELRRIAEQAEQLATHLFVKEPLIIAAKRGDSAAIIEVNEIELCLPNDPTVRHEAACLLASKFRNEGLLAEVVGEDFDGRAVTVSW